MTSASSYSTLVQELYVTYFGRPADYVGLQNFEAALASANAPTDIADLYSAYNSNTAIKSLVDSFGTSAESTNMYGAFTDSAVSVATFVTAIFENELNRIPLQAGLTFWTDAIMSGQLTRGEAALAIAASAQANTTAQGLIDATTIANKLAVAADFTADLATPADIIDYSGSVAAAEGRALIASVTSTTLPDTFQALAEQTFAALTYTPASYPVEFTLTTGVDNLVGISAYNIFFAILDNAAGVATGGAAATLNAGDTILGGPQSNTLNIDDYGLGSAITIPTTATITGITALNIDSTESIGTQDFSAWSRLQAVNISTDNSIGIDHITLAPTTALTVTDTAPSSGSIFTTGGSSVTVNTDANHSIIVSGDAATVFVSVTGGNNNQIEDANYGSALSNSIAMVSVTNADGITTIDSNAVTTLSVSGNNGENVYIYTSTPNSSPLALNLNDNTNLVVEDNSTVGLNVSVVTAASDGLTLIASGATAITFNDAVGLTLTTLTAGDAKTVTISGVGAFTADLTGLNSAAVVNATAATGVTTVTLSSGESFIGGNGAITAGTGANTIVTSTAGALNINLGTHTGFDAITVGANSSAAIFTAISGIAANDTITFSGDAANGLAVQITAIEVNSDATVISTAGSATQLSSWVTTALDNTLQHQVAWFTFAGNTYLVEQANVTGTKTFSGDTVVELIGIHNEANATAISHVFTVA